MDLTNDQLIWCGYIAVGIVIPALNSRFLGLAIAYMVGMLIVYPSIPQGGVLIAILLPSMLLAAFREG